jgi:PAS domain S-box-containing protein
MTDRFEHPAPAADQSIDTLVRQLEYLQPGAHLCPIYSRPAERLRMLVPYFQAGIVRGEQCLYIADDADVDELRAQGLGSDGDPARDVLVMLTARESYLRNGRFDPDKMFELWSERLAAAHAAGFVGLRVTGDTSWALGSDMDSQLLIEYEARLNPFLHTTGIRALCLYDWDRWQPSVLRDVLRTHPLAIIDLRLHNNVYYEPIELVLGAGDVEGARLKWMVSQLQSLTRRDTALVALGRLALEGELSELMRGAPTLVATELGLEHVQIFELLPSGDAVRVVGTTGPDLPAVGTVEPLDLDHPLCSPSLSVGQPLIISNWQQETRFTLPTALQDVVVTSSVSIVICIRAGERVYGILSAHSREGRIFSDDECLFLESVGIFLAYASSAARRAASFRALVENAADVIVRFDADLHLAYVNPAVERVTGTAAESLVGKTSRELGILEPLLPGWELVLRQVWRTGREQAFALTMHTPLGERIFDSRIVPELGPDGDVQSLVSISRDVTEQRRAEAERSALYRELVEQQKRVQELMGRLAEDRERTLERTAAASQLHYLTDRERTILRLMAAGRTNREIGAEIGRTTGTVKNQVAQILSKLSAIRQLSQAGLGHALRYSVYRTPRDPRPHGILLVWRQ